MAMENRKQYGGQVMITGIHHISMKCGTREEFEKARDFYLNVLGFSAVREMR